MEFWCWKNPLQGKDWIISHASAQFFLLNKATFFTLQFGHIFLYKFPHSLLSRFLFIPEHNIKNDLVHGSSLFFFSFFLTWFIKGLINRFPLAIIKTSILSPGLWLPVRKSKAVTVDPSLHYTPFLFSFVIFGYFSLYLDSHILSMMVHWFHFSERLSKFFIFH